MSKRFWFSRTHSLAESVRKSFKRKNGMVDLLPLLSKFEAANDRESGTAVFRTHVPWRAPEAYLSIVYKPADKKTLSTVTKRMRIPAPWVEFLA